MIRCSGRYSTTYRISNYECVHKCLYYMRVLFITYITTISYRYVYNFVAAFPFLLAYYLHNAHYKLLHNQLATYIRSYMIIIKICYFNEKCSDLHNQIQVINNRTLPIISQHSSSTEVSCTSNYSTKMRTNDYH